jgi:hypothetical protein
MQFRATPFCLQCFAHADQAQLPRHSSRHTATVLSVIARIVLLMGDSPGGQVTATRNRVKENQHLNQRDCVEAIAKSINNLPIGSWPLRQQ